MNVGGERRLGSSQRRSKAVWETGRTFWAVTLHSSPASPQPRKVKVMEKKQVPMP